MANENCDVNVPRGHEFAMTAYGSATPYTKRLAFSDWDLGTTSETVRDDGINESSWEMTGDEVIVAERTSGRVSIKPRAEDLQTIALAIFGGAAFATNAKLPGDICEYFQFGHADRKLDRIFNYVNCVTSQATFSAQEKGLLSLDWSIEAQSRTIQQDVATNWDSLALSLSTQQPFAMRQGTLTIAGTSKKFKRVSFTVDNGILADDWFNSLTREEMPSAMQTFTLTHDSPWDDPDDVDALGSITEAAATLEFLSGTKRLYLEFPRLFTVNREPGISGRQRIMNPWQWRAKWIPGNAIDAPLKITIVGT